MRAAGEQPSEGRPASRPHPQRRSSSATGDPGRPRCTRRCCSRPVPPPGWARSVEGTTVSDGDSDGAGPPDVDLRGASASFDWQERKINVIDTPRGPKLRRRCAGRACGVCESAVFVVNAVMGVEVSTSRLWARAAELDIARMLFVNMLDREGAGRDFFRALEQIKRAFRPPTPSRPRSRSAPSSSSRGVIDLVDMKAFRQDSPGAGRLERDPDPRRAGGARAGVSREAEWTRSAKCPTR